MGRILNKMEEIKYNPSWNVEPAKIIYNRMISLLNLYHNLNNEDYPFMLRRVMGFSPIKVNNKEELKGRIKEVCDILSLNIELVNDFNKEIVYKNLEVD